MDGYITKSNRESGDGRGDIFSLPVTIKKTAVIYELKVAKKAVDMEGCCGEALAQIEAKKYGEDVRQMGYKNILKYGVAFYKKDCMIAVSP